MEHSIPAEPKKNALRAGLDMLFANVRHHPVAWFIGATGLWVALPWVAPVLMYLGLDGPAELIYWIYSFQCHQLPQRSFFLFGDKWMYELPEIQAAWYETSNPMALREFLGSPDLGYKVAWSDRMVSMYTSIPLAALLWYPLRRKMRPFPWWLAVLLAVPMALDGGTHVISDLFGLGEGFRYHNAWLADLTGNAFSTSFYVGDSLGSFNSWMRLITGVLFTFGLMGFALPYLFPDQGHKTP